MWFWTQSFISIRDICAAAAVMMTDLHLNSFILSTIPRAVRGFTNRAAPYSNDIPSFNGIQLRTSVTQYSAIAPPILYVPSSNYLLNATRLSLKYEARIPLPTSTTVPEPSQPGVNGYFNFML